MNLDDINPKEIRFVHFLTDQGSPRLATAMRIAADNSKLGEDWLECDSPWIEGQRFRLSNSRIVLVEYGDHVMPEIEED